MTKQEKQKVDLIWKRLDSYSKRLVRSALADLGLTRTRHFWDVNERVRKLQNESLKMSHWEYLLSSLSNIIVKSPSFG